MEAVSKMDIRQSAKKVRHVLDEVKNAKVNDALTKLSFTNKKAAKIIHKTISSALANLMQSEDTFDVDNLYIKRAFVDQGPTMKRFRPAAMGRAMRILKRSSQLTIIISDDKKLKEGDLGQKTNPIGLRLGINRDWDSVWFDEKKFASKLHEDIILRNYINNRLGHASIARIEISRTPKRVSVTIHTARPGIVIGRGGSEVEALKKELKKFMGYDVNINVSEIKRPGLRAELVGQNIAQQLEKKVNYRRAVKKAIQSTMSMGAEGIRVCVSGRLNGNEIARSETYREGRVPLHTLRAQIDYTITESHTSYGIIGVKVWIYSGEKRN